MWGATDSPMYSQSITLKCDLKAIAVIHPCPCPPLYCPHPAPMNSHSWLITPTTCVWTCKPNILSSLWSPESPDLTLTWVCFDVALLLTKCQGLAGPWYARRERDTVNARVQWVQVVRWLRWGREPKLDRRREGNNGLQEIDEDKTKVQLQLLQDTYSWGHTAYSIQT